jgi:hypothetical protein
MTRSVGEEIFENDYVRPLLTKNFQKNEKNRKKILLDIVSNREGSTNDVVYLLAFASYVDVNKYGVC